LRRPNLPQSSIRFLRGSDVHLAVLLFQPALYLFLHGQYALLECLAHLPSSCFLDRVHVVSGLPRQHRHHLDKGRQGIRLPAERRGKRKTKPHVTPEQFEQLLELMPEPYASMVFVAVWTGLRVSELIGLKWEDVGADSLTIDERCCRGDWDAPKSEASNATIGVEPCAIERINRLKQLTVDVNAGHAVRHYKVVKSDRPEDLVFQSVRTGVPMRDNNILSRHIKPAARKLGLPWINWRCLRTSHATWMVEAGANPKDVQGQMRHSRISTTMDIYAQFVPESQRRALAKMSAMVEARTSKPIAPASTGRIAMREQSRMVN
jgi:integrase